MLDDHQGNHRANQLVDGLRPYLNKATWGKIFKDGVMVFYQKDRQILLSHPKQVSLYNSLCSARGVKTLLIDPGSLLKSYPYPRKRKLEFLETISLNSQSRRRIPEAAHRCSWLHQSRPNNKANASSHWISYHTSYHSLSMRAWIHKHNTISST